ncbi:SLC26A/SulP transporter family protein [Thiorhodococcus mannitoliphagus]|uniref:SLC26A/SulP transporter family protein n=1 Tax=Thiorhodococcus mannitoliphagus TaxID=329406 RepID=A0A6P1DTU4_9GAMM|nr:SulP family inorganic anion transporter [Thiorhodococcus mannitoliphagus]NEX19462.1 SLC26A/SulP transporter family protein [Thiorhodococcus mannitoliphagus]
MKNGTENRLTIGDWLGGLAGAAVALPQSMGLGVGLFSAMGLGAAAGALSGLIGAAALSLVSGIGGYTRGMISAPNGPVTMLLIASMATLSAEGISGGSAVVALAVLVVLAGLIQLVIALSGGGQLIKFIPYPMVAGLVTAIGILMMRSQLSPLLARPGDAIPEIWSWLPAATAIVTFAAIKLTPRLLPRMPAIIGGLIVGLVAFHSAAALAPVPLPDAWMVGAIPELEGIHLDLSWAALTALRWDLLFPAAIALAVLASIDCLVTAVVADSATGCRHKARGELACQGVGQILAGLLGGIGGGGTKGSTLVAIGAGGRRWPAVVASLGFILLLAVAGPIGRYLPISVLAGVIIYVGFTMLEWRVLLWLRQPRTRIDGFLALVVVASTLYFDLIIGVGVGALGAMVLFLRDQIRAHTIHTRSTGRELRSLRLRSKEDHALLDEHGDRIVYIELRGHLFFGTVDRLFTELATLLERPVWIVINMRRVQSVDLTALDLFRQMKLRLRAHGGHMLFANIHRGAAQAHKMDKLLRAFAFGYSQPDIKTSFKSTDKALEAAEDLLLSALGRPPTPMDTRIEIADNALFRGIEASVLETLRPLMLELQLPRKARPFEVGAPGDAVYFVIQGVIDLRLPSGDYHYKRLSSIGPGGYFGETAFIEPGPRSADAVVIRDAELLVLSRAAIGDLADRTTDAAALALVLRLARSLVQHLRRARTDIRRLEHW